MQKNQKSRFNFFLTRSLKQCRNIFEICDKEVQMSQPEVVVKLFKMFANN